MLSNAEAEVPDAQLRWSCEMPSSCTAPMAEIRLQLQATHQARALQSCFQTHGLAGVHKCGLMKRYESLKME